MSDLAIAAYGAWRFHPGMFLIHLRTAPSSHRVLVAADVRLVLSSCPRPRSSPYAVRCPRGPLERYYHDYIHRTFSIHHSAPSTGHDKLL